MDAHDRVNTIAFGADSDKIVISLRNPWVLLIQDTTEVDYQQHPTTTGLGPIGNGNHHGYLLQSVLAVVPDSREVLGLMHQEPFLRKSAPQGEPKRQREQRERE